MKQLTIKQRVNTLIVSAYIFIGVFLPCFMRIKTTAIVTLLTALLYIYSMFFPRKRRLDRRIVKLLLSFIPFFSYYVMLSMMIHRGPGLLTYECQQLLLCGIYVAFITLTLERLFATDVIDGERFSYCIIIICIVQLACSVAALANSNIKTYFNDLTINYSHIETIVRKMQTTWRIGYRCYGLAENLFDAFGFIISILIGYCYAWAMERKKPVILTLSIVMLIMPLLNARTGVLLSLVSIIIVILIYEKNVSNLLKYIISAVLIAVVFVHTIPLLPEKLQNALTTGLEETLSFITTGETEGTYEEIANKDIVLPGNIVFGAGLSPDSAEGLKGIDPGYIQCIWRFGVVGTVLLFGTYLYNLSLIYHKGDRFNVAMSVIIAANIILYSFKLFLFNSYSNLFTIFIILTALLYSYDETSNDTKRRHPGLLGDI